MSRTLQFKGYANTVVATTTGAVRELIIDTTNNILTIHDGVTPGGHPAVAAAPNDTFARTLAQQAYNFANTIVSDTQVDPLARTTANTASNNINVLQGVNVTQNTRITSIETVNNNQNTSISLIEGVNVTQNTNISLIEGVNVTQNTNITTVTVTSSLAYNQANTGTVLAQAAYDYANTLVSDTFVDPLARTTSNTASNNITLIEGVNVTQNNRITSIEGVNVTQNTNIVSATNTAQAAFDKANTSGTANIAFNGTDITIAAGATQTYLNITNELLDGGEINITSNSNITIDGGDSTIPGQGGGWVNIYAGNGGPDDGNNSGSGGSIQMEAGLGADAIDDSAGEGGEIRVVAGPGGKANVTNAIAAGQGGRVFIIAGTAGDTDGDSALSVNGPNVEIYGGLGSFDGSNMIGRPGDVITQGGGDGWVGASGNVITKTSSDGYDFHTWKYDNQGRTLFPALGVPRGDTTGGSISGYTLLIGEGDNEAIISTPNGNATYNNSQRLVINPGKGADGTAGEGGDIYLWAGRGGDTGGSGGDIKIRGGQGMGTSGAGGYIRMEAGDGYTDAGSPGYIELLGGTGGSGLNGGYVSVKGGYGQVDGGDTEIRGGSGNAGFGGEVNIIGGDSNQGADSYGNVTVTAGSSTWYFRNNGFMDLPGEGVLQSTNDTITLRSLNTTSGNANSVYLGTSGGLGFNDMEIGGNWLEIFRLGTNPQIRSYDELMITANVSTWNFGNTGTLTVPGGIFAANDFTLQVASGIPSGVDNWNGQGGWNQSSYNDLATTGGTGTGLTVNVAAAGSGYININQITINTPGTGYTDGDVITIDNENNLPGTFTITVSVPGWNFKSDGALEFSVNSGTAPKITANTSNNYIAIVNGAGDTWSFKDNGQLTIPGGVTVKSNVKTVNSTPTTSTQGSPGRIWTASNPAVIGAQIICRSNVDYDSYIELCTINIVGLLNGAGNTQVMITGQVGTTSGTAVNTPYSPVSFTAGVDGSDLLYAEAIAGSHDAHHVVSVTEFY